METDSPLSVAWVLVNSFLVISMQLGFAMLEVGSVREVHRMTVLAKNILDSCVSCLAFSTSCALLQPSIIYRDGYAQQHLMVFQWAFCATCVTICSGAMAERTHMLAYLTFTALMGGVVYPILAESAWGNGLFRDQFHDRFHEGYSYHDFAGSGVVHLVGGTGALVGNLILGRRIMQPEQGHFGAFGFEQGQHNLALGDAFRSGAAGAPGGDQSGEQALEEKDENDVLLKQGGGWPRRFDNLDRDRVEFMPLGYLQVTGMFTLWVGWYGFNAGSTLAMDPSAATAAGVIAWNTTMAAAMGGFGAFLSCCFFRERLDVGFISNGVLTGLVSITASCDVASTGDSAVLGLLSGLVVYPLSSYGLQVLRVDDPVDAVPVHLFGGLLGVFAVGLCQPDCVALESLGGGQAEQQRFCLAEHDVRRQMLAQVWGSLLELSFAAGCALVVWGFLAVSECARALEGDLLDRACELLRAPAGVAPPPQGAAPEAGQAESAAMALRAIAKESPLARAVLRSHGLTSRGFAEGSPADAGRLRQDLQQARRERAETALEAGCVCGALAEMVHRCWPLRELALLRLRISPGNELSGLGAAATDRSQMVHSARRMVLQLVRAEEGRRQRVPAPLQREVQELGAQLESHQAVLLDLLRRRGRKGSSSRSRLGQLDQGVPASSGLSERGTLVAPDAPAAHKQGGHEGLVARSHEPAPLVLGKSASSAGWSDSTACAEQPVSGGARGTDEDGQSSRDPRARRARRSPRATPSETSGSSLVSSETGSSGLAIAAQSANVQDALMRTLEAQQRLLDALQLGVQQPQLGLALAPHASAQLPAAGLFAGRADRSPPTQLAVPFDGASASDSEGLSGVGSSRTSVTA